MGLAQQDDLRVTAITVESGQVAILSGVSLRSEKMDSILQQQLKDYYQGADYNLTGMTAGR